MLDEKFLDTVVTVYLESQGFTPEYVAALGANERGYYADLLRPVVSFVSTHSELEQLREGENE